MRAKGGCNVHPTGLEFVKIVGRFCKEKFLRDSLPKSKCGHKSRKDSTTDSDSSSDDEEKSGIESQTYG
jgi:hypothetical protein